MDAQVVHKRGFSGLHILNFIYINLHKECSWRHGSRPRLEMPLLSYILSTPHHLQHHLKATMLLVCTLVALLASAALNQASETVCEVKTPPTLLHISLGFLDFHGYILPSCRTASDFALRAGELTSNSLPYSTSQGIRDAQFKSSNVQQPITTFFSVNDGLVEWKNAAFDQGAARFCARLSQPLLAVFSGPFPDGCSNVVLRAVPNHVFGAQHKRISAHFGSHDFRYRAAYVFVEQLFEHDNNANYIPGVPSV
ncbi:MAG: hypothetical protein Q9168_000443 [Polycauliona sp. 1 TL-2023]